MKTTRNGQKKFKFGWEEVRFALLMVGAACFLATLMLSAVPGTSAAQVCTMHFDGPLAGTCLR